MGRRADRYLKVAVTFERRPDGGLRAFSADVPGFHLSGPDPEAVFNDVVPALETLFKCNRNMAVRFGAVTDARAELEANGLLPPQADRETREYVAPLGIAA